MLSLKQLPSDMSRIPYRSDLSLHAVFHCATGVESATLLLLPRSLSLIAPCFLRLVLLSSPYLLRISSVSRYVSSVSPLRFLRTSSAFLRISATSPPYFPPCLLSLNALVPVPIPHRISISALLGAHLYSVPTGHPRWHYPLICRRIGVRFAGRCRYPR